MKFLSFCLITGLFFSFPDSCSKKKRGYKIARTRADIPAEVRTVQAAGKELPDFEKSLIEAGLVNIKELDSTFVVDLRYSTENNFMGTDVYGDWENAYLQPDVAEKLVLAQHLLRVRHFHYSIIVFDAARPVSVQRIMWSMLDMPARQKTKYLSNPNNGSLHNYGAAADVSIVDENRQELDMGTPYDFFGELAYPRKEEMLLNQGKLTQQQVDNRKLLREVMMQAGFTPLATEWWHFNSCSRREAAKKYNLIE